jgi:hypothetical protein
MYPTGRQAFIEDFRNNFEHFFSYLMKEKIVITVDELINATNNANISHIVVSGELVNTPTIRLSNGQSLRGESKRAAIRFSKGTDGLQISSDNQIHNIHLITTQNKRVVFNDTNVEHLGRIELHGVTTAGKFRFWHLTRYEVDTLI